MAGNVIEWVADLYGPYSTRDQTDPLGPRRRGAVHVLRGGAYNAPLTFSEVNYRRFGTNNPERARAPLAAEGIAAAPNERPDFGMRVARSAD